VDQYQNQLEIKAESIKVAELGISEMKNLISKQSRQLDEKKQFNIDIEAAKEIEGQE
jgi:hypothetical protein